MRISYNHGSYKLYDESEIGALVKAEVWGVWDTCIELVKQIPTRN
jgi:hypothetical protein